VDARAKITAKQTGQNVDARAKITAKKAFKQVHPLLGQTVRATIKPPQPKQFMQPGSTQVLVTGGNRLLKQTSGGVTATKNTLYRTIEASSATLDDDVEFDVELEEDEEDILSDWQQEPPLKLKRTIPGANQSVSGGITSAPGRKKLLITTKNTRVAPKPRITPITAPGDESPPTDLRRKVPAGASARIKPPPVVHAPSRIKPPPGQIIRTMKSPVRSQTVSRSPQVWHEEYDTAPVERTRKVPPGASRLTAPTSTHLARGSRHGPAQQIQVIRTAMSAPVARGTVKRGVSASLQHRLEPKSVFNSRDVSATSQTVMRTQSGSILRTKNMYSDTYDSAPPATTIQNYMAPEPQAEEYEQYYEDEAYEEEQYQEEPSHEYYSQQEEEEHIKYDDGYEQYEEAPPPEPVRRYEPPPPRRQAEAAPRVTSVRMQQRALVTQPRREATHYRNPSPTPEEDLYQPLSHRVSRTETVQQVQRIQTVQRTDSVYRVVITNLHPLNVTEDDLLELFGAVGALKKVAILKPGTGEITFYRKDEALAAIKKYHMRELDGLPMHLVLAGSPQSPPQLAPPVKLPASARLSAPRPQSATLQRPQSATIQRSQPATLQRPQPATSQQASSSAPLRRPSRESASAGGGFNSAQELAVTAAAAAVSARASANVQPSEPEANDKSSSGPLRFGLSVDKPRKNKEEIDPQLIHKALFKTGSKDEPRTKPVSFTVKI